MDSSSNILSVNNPLFRSYLTHVGVLVLKMMVMTVLTIRQRTKNNAYISAEDAKFFVGEKAKVNKQHPDVERVRSGHLNDLESIPIFVLAAFGFLFTNPSVHVATTLFRTFTVCRILHTIVYVVYVVPQPARGTIWLCGYLITGYMALTTILHFNAF